MKYNVTRVDSDFVLSADNSETFFSEFSKLPAGEYTVSVLSASRRSGKHHRKLPTRKVANIIGIVLEVAAILLMLASVIPLWIIGCALA